MRVHFGLHLDGLDPAVPKTSLGEARVGPLGLLEMLETDLGLPPASRHPADELARYRSCLAEADDFARFYHASFSVDPVNVARTLMGWRAAWYESGWSGAFSQAPARLADMAAVEVLARKRGCRCIGQRLQEVEVALRERRTQIEQLLLLDLPDELPAAWQRVVDRIGYRLHPAAQPAPAADAGTDLGKVQAQLALAEADAAPLAKESLAGDGTFVVLRGASRDLTAQAVAEHLRGADPARTALLAPEHGVALDNALERADLPRCGFAHRSRLRPVAQVLRLVLALLWKPLDARLLLQLLHHPIAPLPWRLRRALAEAVAAQPGMGGERWQAAIDQALAAQDAPTLPPASDELGDGEADPGAARKNAAALRRAIAFWLQAPRFPTHPGAPLAAVSERTRRLGDWLRRRSRAQVGDALAHREALGQCRALENALRELANRGQLAISRLELDRLLSEVALPQPHPQHVQQAASARAAAHPGAVIDRFDEVVWWGLGAQRPHLASPWSAAELEALEAAGAQRPDAQTQLRILLRSWGRPVLNCARRFVLATHSEAGLSHPLLSHLRPRLQGWKEVALDEHLLNGRGLRLDALRLRTPVLTVRPLPSPKRWWQLPAGAKVQPRAWESYTSLGKLCDFPHDWVLRYIAGLSPGRAADLADGALLRGSLAHRMLERFFAEQAGWAKLPDADVTGWLHDALPRLLAEEGAVLLERGRGADRQNFAATAERALLRLLAHLRAASVEDVRTEVEQAGRCRGFEVRGSIDLLLRTAAGREIVMDAKWGSERVHLRDMATGRHLQLAVYAWLRQAANGGAWPYPAYYILSTGNVLAPDRDVFPYAVAAGAEASVGDVWQRLLATRAWRLEQLDAGAVEVNALGAMPDERSVPPPDALPQGWGPGRFDLFRWLTGRGPFD